MVYINKIISRYDFYVFILDICLTKNNNEFMSVNKPLIVQKEDIEKLVFPHESIERTEEQTKELNKKLQDAMSLGNLHHTKIKIIFEDSEGLKEVETTVWVAGDNYISLKAGVSIPVRRIVEVRF